MPNRGAMTRARQPAPFRKADGPSFRIILLFGKKETQLFIHGQKVPEKEACVCVCGGALTSHSPQLHCKSPHWMLCSATAVWSSPLERGGEKNESTFQTHSNVVTDEQGICWLPWFLILTVTGVHSHCSSWSRHTAREESPIKWWRLIRARFAKVVQVGKQWEVDNREGNIPERLKKKVWDYKHDVKVSRLNI